MKMIEACIPIPAPCAVRAYERIICQLERWQMDKSARVSDDETLARKFGFRRSQAAIAMLTPEQNNLRQRALIIQRMKSSDS